MEIKPPSGHLPKRIQGKDRRDNLTRALVYDSNHKVLILLTAYREMKIYKNSQLGEPEAVELFVKVRFWGFVFWLVISASIGFLIGKYF